MRVPAINQDGEIGPDWSQVPAVLRDMAVSAVMITSTEYEISFYDAADLRLDVDKHLGTVAAWVQPSGAHDAYDEGAIVKHDSTIWESTTPDNVWEPGESGWREIGVALPDLRDRIAALADVRGQVESADNVNQLRTAVLSLVDTLTGEA